ncbi:hypothetical protein SRB5_05330 [Streptomyces sp. RB5]|uniref:Peptidoglycan binding-like domain-containing protein n=1 Tax=Streptomyces smaragdinus TaxID=2585196 RepID=A0A7K0CAF3_9ACTN|nr:peptidoglycan-binding domain-containing protein [Streptomyces smaragdinus]MQY10425.1 hypothetical protein [Streptomyces smaragdinus]
MESDIRRPCGRCRAIGPCTCAWFTDEERPPLTVRPYAPPADTLPAPYGSYPPPTAAPPLPYDDDPIDLGLFAPDRPDPRELGPPRPSRRRSHRAPTRRRNLTAALFALVTTAATAGVVTLGLKAFDDTDHPTRVLPDPTRSAPDLAPDDEETPTPKPSAKKPKASPSTEPRAATATPAPSRSYPPSRSPRPDHTAPGGAGRPAPTSPPPSSPAPSSPAPTSAPSTLRRGDEGPEVTELQHRLGQLRLYDKDADGVYDRDTYEAVRTYQNARGITADPPGVYGPATREALERETS